ncbi:hypothetical protein V8C35DRAFT_127048 [Trichoderma chlorosporum]
MIMSPDAVSLLFPDRPIRPLPKRRLRERLSPEVASSIKYPSYVHDHAPLFYYPSYTTRDDHGTSNLTTIGSTLQHHRDDSKRNSTLRRNGAAMTAVINDELRGSLLIGSSSKVQGMVIQSSMTVDPLRQTIELPLIASTASSVDGYESFENTNNKKKRKIPTTGDSLTNSGLTLSNNISSLSISIRPRSPVSEIHNNIAQLPPAGLSGNSSHGTGSQGLSGSGRGRLGRSRNGRSPLRALPDGSNAWSNRSKVSSQWVTSGSKSSSIISNAIATAEKAPLQGKENGSLLQPRLTTHKEMPASTQFTFTCESHTPGAIQWPGRSAGHGSSAQSLQHLPTVTPTSPDLRQDESSKQASRLRTGSARKTRSRLERELVIAARTRRQLATENYYHSLLDTTEIWICEFCEYERIFGEPPRTLIRDYEIKDRRHRQEEADRKRLLEKAKAKSRKGKKNSKGATKGGHTTEHVSDQPHGAARPADISPALTNERGRSNHSDDGYEDDYEDDYEDAPPRHMPNVAGTHADPLPPSRAKT